MSLSHVFENLIGLFLEYFRLKKKPNYVNEFFRLFSFFLCKENQLQNHNNDYGDGGDRSYQPLRTDQNKLISKKSNRMNEKNASSLQINMQSMKKALKKFGKIPQRQERENFETNPIAKLLSAELKSDRNIFSLFESSLDCSFKQCLSKKQILPCFVQFMESSGQYTHKLIKCFLQAQCLRIFVEENLSEIDLKINNEDEEARCEGSKSETSKSQRDYFEEFQHDFHRLHERFLHPNSDCYILIDYGIQTQIDRLFDKNSNNNHDHKSSSSASNENLIRIFYSLWNVLANQIESKYYENFLRSKFYLQYELNVLSNHRKLHLSDILFANSAITSTFIDFMHTKKMKKYLDFLLVFKNYRLFSEQHQDALIIANRFFKTNNPESFLECNETIRNEIIHSIQDQDHFKNSCFDTFAKILMEFIEKNYLPQFIRGSLFQEYLQNCQRKLANSDEKPSMISKQSLFNHDVNPDSVQSQRRSHLENQSLDNENLWDRNLKGHLQFTYIDKYGRINNTLQPEPSSRMNNNKFTRLFRKLSFSQEEDESKQDDAWKVAESIINDVCSVTNLTTTKNC